MPIRVSSKRSAAAPGKPPFGLPEPPSGVMQKLAGISLCMIVKNEERFLEQCLQSVADIVDEICIVDTGSTDRTVEIAKAFGARVELRPWRNDFSWARNEAISLAGRRWVIMLDADEELTPESKPALQQLKDAPAYHTGLWLRCYNKADDYGGTGAMSHALVRMFPNNERIRFRGMIHEFVTLDGGTTGLGAVTAPVSIVHHGYLKEVVESRGKAERNLEIVKAAVEADPTDPFTWFNLGSTAFMMNDFVTTRDALEKMRELNGNAPRGFVANGLSILAETYCDKLGDPSKGEEVAQAALRVSPHYANAHFQLGKALVAQRRFDEARAAYGDAIADKDFANQQFVVDDQVYVWKAHSEIGSSYVVQGDEESAIEWFERGLKNAPGVQPLMLNLARSLDRLGRYDEAGALFKEVYEKFRDAYGTVDYVNFLLRRNHGETAVDVIEAMYEKLKPETAAPLLVAAAQISARLGRPEELVHYLELAADRAPGSADILNELEAAYRASGDVEGLARMLERESVTPPLTTADFLRRSFKANERGDFSAGLMFADSGLAKAPGDEHLAYNAAVAASSLGENERALGHLDRVATITSPVYLPALALRARLYRAENRADEAVGAVEQILALDARNVDALLIKASLAEERGDMVVAEASLRDVAMIDSQRGAIELGTLFMRLGRFEEAARIADAALQK
jgi:tetratricopeptide (TPR) repeat protein